MCAGSNTIIYDSIKDGYVYGTSTQDPGVEGALAVSTLIEIINGKNSTSMGRTSNRTSNESYNR